MIRHFRVDRRKCALLLLAIYTVSLMFWDYLAPSKVAAVVLVAGYLLLQKGRIKKISSVYILAYMIFTLYFVLHTLVGLARDNNAAWNAIYTLALNGIIAVALVNYLCVDREFLYSYMKIFIFCAFLVCCYNLIIKRADLFNGQLTINCPKPFSIEVYSHNDVPGYAVIAAFFIVYLYGAKIFRRTHAISALAFFFLFILLSGARKSTIGVLMAMIVYPYIFMTKKHSMAQKLIRVFIAVGMIVIIYIVITNNAFLYNLIGYKFQDVVQGLTSGEFEESSSKSRNLMIMTGLELIKLKPFTGYGLRAWSTWNGLIGAWTHNMLIELVFSGGIIVPFIYYSFYIDFFKGLTKRVNTDLMASMMFCFMIYMVIHELLSVSFLSRMVSLMYCYINAYLNIEKRSLKTT